MSLSSIVDQSVESTETRNPAALTAAAAAAVVARAGAEPLEPTEGDGAGVGGAAEVGGGAGVVEGRVLG